MSIIKVGIRYGINLADMVSRHNGRLAGFAAGTGYVFKEALKLPKYAIYRLTNGNAGKNGKFPILISPQIQEQAKQLSAEHRPYTIDVSGFKKHQTQYEYPAFYAAGPMADRGQREQKLLEYFVSLDFLQIKPNDVLIDVASEWSLFPDMVRKLYKAKVYQQDLIYPHGVHGFTIGGSAAKMPVESGFANQIVLHNAIEHFEGTADSDFVTEAFRVLKPGGVLCILPLFLSDDFANLTDPMMDRTGIQYDPGAKVVELPLIWHNRFGRFYDSAAAERRLIQPALKAGFKPILYHVQNVKEAHPQAYLHFALVMQKPSR
jgi:SAM-dependent methyltransferase